MRTRGRGGAGRRRVPGTAPCRPGPLHPGTAELASCRGTTLPRPQRDPGARAGGNIVPASGQLERAAAGRALGGCAGLPAPGSHAPGGAGSPGSRRNLAAAGRVGRQLAFLSPRQPPFLSALQGGTSVPPSAWASDPSSPGLVLAEQHNFPRAWAKVSAKCCPSCGDGAAKPVRGARGGTRAPPGRWSGDLDGRGVVT